jgi:hypothetical protein
MIWCKKFVSSKKLIKKKQPQEKPVQRNWLEPCKTVHPSKLKPVPMSNKVKEIVEQRILTNLAISRARASIRAAKREKARTEAEQESAELDQKTALSEPVNAKTSKGSRRPPNPLVVYKKYLERCKAASEARVRRFGQESASHNFPPEKSGPSLISKQNQPSTSSAVCGHNLICDQDTATRKVSARKVTYNESLPDPSDELNSESTLRTSVQSKKMQKPSNRRQESGEGEGLKSIDQPGSSEDDDNMFKKPFPVKHKTPKQKAVIKEGGNRKDKIRNRRHWVVDKMNAIKKTSPVLKDLHPSVLVNQKMAAARIMKLLSEKEFSQKMKQNTWKGQTGKAVDLFEMLHDIVLLICDQVSYTVHL